MKLCVLGMTVVLLAGPAVADKLDDSFQSLKDAVAKKDATQVKTLVTELNPMIREELSAPAPSGEDDKKSWSDHIDYVKSVGEYCEYALYATAVQSPSETMVDLISTLEKLNPKSKYMDQAYGLYLVALNKTGASSKIPAIAAKALQNFPDNVDLLSVMMEATYGKQNSQSLVYANRLIAALEKPKPADLSAEEWERLRGANLGRAHWMAGVIYCSSGNYAAGDRDLRAALPAVTGNAAMAGPALFYLGMANYNLAKMTNSKAKMLEAVKFSKESSAIAGPFSEQARHNAIVMQTEADRMR